MIHLLHIDLTMLLCCWGHGINCCKTRQHLLQHKHLGCPILSLFCFRACLRDRNRFQILQTALGSTRCVHGLFGCNQYLFCESLFILKSSKQTKRCPWRALSIMTLPRRGYEWQHYWHRQSQATHEVPSQSMYNIELWQLDETLCVWKLIRWNVSHCRGWSQLWTIYIITTMLVFGI